MGIDFSTQSDEWWKASFERYITGGNDFGTIANGGSDAIESHFKFCLPAADYPDKKLQVTREGWIISATHPRGGPFELRVNRDTSWEFVWL